MTIPIMKRHRHIHNETMNWDLCSLKSHSIWTIIQTNQSTVSKKQTTIKNEKISYATNIDIEILVWTTQQSEVWSKHATPCIEFGTETSGLGIHCWLTKHFNNAIQALMIYYVSSVFTNKRRERSKCKIMNIISVDLYKQGISTKNARLGDQNMALEYGVSRPKPVHGELVIDRSMPIYILMK